MSRPPERRRIAVACENCRARKVRCDGSRPVCCACARREDTCRYTVSLAPWERRRQRYVAELERRLDVLEGAHLSPGHQPVHLPVHQPVHQPVHHTDPAQHVSPSPPARSHPGDLDDTPDDAPSSMYEHDWQGNTGSQVAPDCPPRFAGSVHLGQSSTGVFIRELQNTIARPTPRTSTRGLSLEDLGSSPRVNDTHSSPDYLLPPRQTANELLNIYWSEHHPLYPAVRKNEFLLEFDGLYTGVSPSEDVRMTHCLANLMFALAERGKRRVSRSSSSSSNNGGGGTAYLDYFARARRLLHFDIFGDVSFRAVQALVLCAQFLQSSEKPRQCWVIVGLGIRAAQSMGLHLPETVKNLESARDRHLAAVVCSCLVTIDRTLSMTLGRSPTLSLPAARTTGVANCLIETQTQDGAESTGPDSFFAHSYYLFDILHEILAVLYREDTTTNTPVIDVLSHTSRLEKALDRWTRALPPRLRLSPCSESLTPAAAGSQAAFLRQRYLQVYMILMRPGLSVTIQSTTTPSTMDDSTLEEATAWYSAQRCIAAATEMAAIVSAQASCPPNARILTPWWYRVQFCYNAGVSLLAARLSGRTAGRVGAGRLDEGIGNCVRALKGYGGLSPTAPRCLAAFASVAEKAGNDLPGVGEEVSPAGTGWEGMEGDGLEGLMGEGWWGVDEWMGGVFPFFDQVGL